MKSCPSWSNILVSGKASLDHTSREAAEVADKDGGESGEKTETRPPSPAAAGICVSGGLSWRGEAERQLQAHHHGSAKATKIESSCLNEIPHLMLPMGMWGPENMKIKKFRWGLFEFYIFLS